MKEQGVKKLILRPSPTLPFLNKLQERDTSEYPHYDNVSVQNLLEIKVAITLIWLSLYSPEAIEFRKKNGIAQYHS
jgi:hypothetical protein